MKIAHHNLNGNNNKINVMERGTVLIDTYCNLYLIAF